MTTKNSIAFNCHTCDRCIVRDSEEHDHSCCDEDNEDNWYCCECFHDFIVKKEQEKEVCGWCSVGNRECDCDKCGVTGCFECVSGGHGLNEDLNLCPECAEEKEATTEFARNKICDECGCKGGCELTCVYVCGKKKPKKKKKQKRLVIVDKPKWHQKCSKCDNIKHDCDWVYCLENRAYCGDCSPSSSCDLTYCQACH